jgi:putative glutathione S-transferase
VSAPPLDASARAVGRISTDGSTSFPAAAGRYELRIAPASPWAHRASIVHALANLGGVVDVVAVEDVPAPGRPWRHDDRRPQLVDRTTDALVSDDPRAITIDLAARFRSFACPVVETYPADLAAEIEGLDRWLGPVVNDGAVAAGAGGAAARDARIALVDALETLDVRLGGDRFLLGERLTEADVRLWVTLVRYDVGPNADRTISPALDAYPHLWAYARCLYRIPAFRTTTSFRAFARPGVHLLDWDAPTTRARREVAA